MKFDFRPQSLSARSARRIGAAHSVFWAGGFKIEVPRGVGAGKPRFLLQQQMLPPATHRIEGRGLLLFGVVLLRKRQLQSFCAAPPLAIL